MSNREQQIWRLTITAVVMMIVLVAGCGAGDSNIKQSGTRDNFTETDQSQNAVKVENASLLPPGALENALKLILRDELKEVKENTDGVETKLDNTRRDLNNKTTAVVESAEAATAKAQHATTQAIGVAEKAAEAVAESKVAAAEAQVAAKESKGVGWWLGTIFVVLQVAQTVYHRFTGKQLFAAAVTAAVDAMAQSGQVERRKRPTPDNGQG